MQNLTTHLIQQFIHSGYVKIENAFSQEIAAACRSILWKATKLAPNKPETWTEPVIRIGELEDLPFQQAANTPILLNSFKQLAFDNWLPRQTLGTFPIRFPSKTSATDTGWHMDASFPSQDPSNYFDWKININSSGRALLMLFLFSDTTEEDAPTKIKEGSHLDVSKVLQKAGDEGLTFMQLAERLENLPHRNEVSATGKAGTVYLCHPFLVHGAQNHRGITPKFMAQPALLSKRDFNIDQPVELSCPIEKAIILGINN